MEFERRPRACGAASADKSLRFDWIQYRANFREPVAIRPILDRDRRHLLGYEIAVDRRRVRDDVDVTKLNAQPEVDGVHLEPFAPLSRSVIWRFNRLYWEHLAAWESALGHRYDESLPKGADAADPEAVGAAVERCWSLLRDLETRGELPATVYILELAVGTGRRAELWLDKFRALDAERGTSYYARLRCVLCDLSAPTLERVRARLAAHDGVIELRIVDALDPLATLADLRGQVLGAHLANLYDNLVCDELALRRSSLFRVEVRAYIANSDVDRLVHPREALQRLVQVLLDHGPDAIRDGLSVWRALWAALRLEERLVRIDVEEAASADVDAEALHTLVAEAPAEVRFHLSSAAARSFARTLPLLHPRGFLVVQDLFTRSLSDYLEGFRGPGKLDGSVVNWVNGLLLRAVGERNGYEVRIAPLRAGSKVSILTASRRA